MTTNQTIDGVPRELLERLIDSYACHDNNPHCHLSSDQEAIDDLRALLDAPACKTCHDQGEVPTGETTYQGHWQPPEPVMESCPECGGEPAAQPQGEPVAWEVTGGGVKPGLFTFKPGWAADDSAYTVRALVYAEQPSPVAVVHPFAEKVIRKLERFQECADDGQGADIGRHWFDLLTQLGLLNRVQRSPALWEMTQQGEDALELSRQSAKSR